ncbi:MAG: hypothetical protein GC179_22130 [Anaerolineaceae bacterium]|nr:hypothetical protein [Anaerolineaceae bacterium]
MPYEYHWFDSDHTIIQMDIYGQVTWDQWHKTIDKIVEEIKHAPHRVDIIFRDTVGMPKGNPIPHLTATQKKLHAYPNTGLLITVSSRRISSFVEMIIDVMQRGSEDRKKHNGGFVTTMDEALSRIYASRSQNQANK